MGLFHSNLLKFGICMVICFMRMSIYFSLILPREKYHSCMKNTFVEKYIADNKLSILQCDEEKPW